MDHLALVQDLWDALYIEHPLSQADAIIGFGSYDQSIPVRAAHLYREGWAPRILFTGGYGKGTLGVFPQPEAALYADIAAQEGVPREDILVEDRSTNTGENIRFSRELFARHDLTPRRIIAVHKPYMTRRVWASLRRQWPQVEVIVAPGDRSLQRHLDDMRANGVPEDEVIHSLVGDFQRMEVYARMGYQIPQEVPRHTLASYEALVAMGYDRYVVKA